jgi:hypothetical protein
MFSRRKFLLRGKISFGLYDVRPTDRFQFEIVWPQKKASDGSIV